MAFTIAVLGGAALVGGGIAEGINALTNKPKSLSDTALALPDQNKANKDAAAQVADQRAVLLNAGGVTDYTGGLGVLTGSDVTKTSLIGG